jgi:hypothetical protein
VRVCVCMHICAHICKKFLLVLTGPPYACMYVCMYIRMYVYVYIASLKDKAAQDLLFVKSQVLVYVCVYVYK